jgi:hypothetical protein
MKKQKRVCVICGKTYTNGGSDARPVADGRCCFRCDDLIVTPARLSAITGHPVESFMAFAKDMHALTKFYRLLRKPKSNGKNGD